MPLHLTVQDYDIDQLFDARMHKHLRAPNIYVRDAHELSQIPLREQYKAATARALAERSVSIEGDGLKEAIYTLIGMVLTENMQLKDQIERLKRDIEARHG